MRRVRMVVTSAALLATGAACGNESGSTGPTLVRTVVLSPSTKQLLVGEAFALSVSTLGENGQRVTPGSTTWKSIDQNVVTVTTHGIIRGMNPGTSGVVVDSDGVADTTMVTVVRTTSGT
jgi:hypothetical protein